MKKKKKFLHIPLGLFGLSIWGILWFMGMGTITSSDELNITLKPIFSSGEKYAQLPFFPSWPTLKSIIQVLCDMPIFFDMFWNTCKQVFFQIIGQFFVATPAAWAIAQMRFKERRAVYLLYIILMLMPFQVTMLPNYLILYRLHLLNTAAAIIIPGIFSAFPVFIMTRGFHAIQRPLLEAAALDGAGYLRTFLSIGIPIGFPGIMAALMISFVEAWNTIEQPMLFLKDKSEWPLSLLLPEITEQNLGVSMVISMVVLLPPTLIFLFGQKYLETGLQTGSVKE